MKKKEIIILTKFIPAPAYSGGAKRNLSWIKFLSKYYKIHLIGFYDKQFGNKMIHELKKYGLSIYGIYFERNLLKNSIKSIVNHKSIINLQYFNKKILDLLNNVLAERKIEFIMCEELAMMQYCQSLSVPVYFDDHNIEYILMNRTAKCNSNIFLKILLYRDSRLIKKEEIEAFNKANKIFVVSENDKNYIDKNLEKKITVVNNTYEAKKAKKNNCYRNKKISIVFVGNASWKPNHDGLIHFIKHIFPLILEKNSKVIIKIVGSNMPKDIVKQQNHNILIYENATEKLKDKIIDESMLCIVPIYFGGGTRIKILEYWSHSKAVVSTSLGAEGLISSKGTYICDSDESFANKILYLISNQDILLNAGNENHNIFKNNYSEEVVYEDTLYNTINSK